MVGQAAQQPEDGIPGGIGGRPRPAASTPRSVLAAASEEHWAPVADDDVALVIRRAVELEEKGGSSADAGLDGRLLVDIGEEIGLSPEAVHQALEEYQAGLLRSAGPSRAAIIGPRTLVITRTVPGPVGRVDALLGAFLERKLFDCCRRAGHRTVWRPREGLFASLQRATKRFGRDRLLDDVTEITVSLTEVAAAPGQPPRVHVRIEAECRALRRGLTTTAVGGAAVGAAGAVAAAGVAIATGDALPLLGLPPAGALGVGAYVGSRAAYRGKLAEVELVVQGGLDDLVATPRRR